MTNQANLALTITPTNATTFSFQRLLNPDQLAEARRIADAFRPEKNKSTEVAKIGSDVLRDTAGLTKPLLNTVQIRDLGPARAAIESVVETMRGIDLDVKLGKQNVLEKLLPQFFDRVATFFRSLQTVQTQLDAHEADLIDIVNTITTRIGQLDQLTEMVFDQAPQLYVYAAALELITEREQTALDTLISSATPTSPETPVDPATPQLVTVQRHYVANLRLRMLNVKSAATQAFLMIPVLQQTQEVAQTMRNEVENAINSLMPSFRLTIAAMIAQGDIQDAAHAVTVMQNAQLQLNMALANSLGNTNAALQEVVEGKRELIPSLGALRDSIVQQLQETIAHSETIRKSVSEADTVFGEIQSSIQTAVTELKAQAAA